MSANSENDFIRTVTLPDGVDLHARPAGQVVRAAGAQSAAVTLRAGGKEADAKSILQVLALGATGGTPVEIETSGEGASEALDVISDLIAQLS